MIRNMVLIALAAMLLGAGSSQASRVYEPDAHVPRHQWLPRLQAPHDRLEEIQAPRGERPEDIQAPRGSRTSH